MSDLIAAAIARILGLAALVGAAHWAIADFLPALLGGDEGALFTAFYMGLVVAFFLAIASSLLVPPRTRQIMRIPRTQLGRTLRAVVLGALAPFVLISAINGLIALEIAGQESTGLLHPAAAALCAAFYWHFLLPGGYARRLDPAPAENTDSDENDPEPAHHHLSWLPDLFNPTLYLILFALFFALSGFYAITEAQFLPSADHHNFIEQNRWEIASGATLLLTVSILLLPLAHMRRGRHGVVRRMVFGAAIGGSCFGSLTIESASTGLPALVSLILPGEHAVMRATIVAIGQRERRHACDLVLYIRPPVETAPGPRQICDVPWSIWNSAQLGQRLVLRGTRHPWGFRYETVVR